MKEGRSSILIIRSLDNKNLQESTVNRVLSIILDTKKQYGEEAAERIATQLIEIVDSSETEEALLQVLNQVKVPTIERLKPMHERFVRNFSDATNEMITQIIEYTRIHLGHVSAEEVAKEIRERIESGISETELLPKLEQIHKTLVSEYDKIDKSTKNASLWFEAVQGGKG